MEPTQVATNDHSLSSVEISSRQKSPPSVVVKVFHADPDVAAREALRIFSHVTVSVRHYGANVIE